MHAPNGFASFFCFSLELGCRGPKRRDKPFTLMDMIVGERNLPAWICGAKRVTQSARAQKIPSKYPFVLDNRKKSR
jgi:hypothetical protein